MSDKAHGEAVNHILHLAHALTVTYGSQRSELPKKDNLHIKDKSPAPNLSSIQKFHCIVHGHGLLNTPAYNFVLC